MTRRGIAALGIAAWLVGGSLAGGAELGLDEVLAAVDSAFPKLLAAERERAVARGKLLEKQGAFDPVLEMKREDQEFFDANDKFKEKEKLSFAVDVPTRSGAKWSLGGRSSESWLGGKGPKERDTLLVGVKLPLGRDATINPKLGEEKKARIGVGRADAEFAGKRIGLLLKAAQGYFKWVAAARSLAVAEDLLALARARAEAIGEQVAAGDAPRLAAVEAEQEAVRREGLTVKARRGFEKAALELGLFLWDAEGNPAGPPGRERVPRGAVVPQELTPAEVEAAIARGVAARPELATLEAEAEAARVDLALAKNEGRAAVDLFYNSGRDSALEVFDELEKRLQAGIKVTVPLRRRSAFGAADQARAKLEKLDFERALLRQAIETEVRDAAQEWTATVERWRAARDELGLARELEAGERDRWEHGDSTLFLVNQRERARAEAELKLIEVEAEYEADRVLLRAVQAQL